METVYLTCSQPTGKQRREWEKGRVTDDGREACFEGDENVVKLTVAIVAQLH